ncbi:MAG: hypothetical protein ABI433_10925 [Burkholderiaceae bacterium]
MDLSTSESSDTDAKDPFLRRGLTRKGLAERPASRSGIWPTWKWAWAMRLSCLLAELVGDETGRGLEAAVCRAEPGRPGVGRLMAGHTGNLEAMNDLRRILESRAAGLAASALMQYTACFVNDCRILPHTY